MRINSIDKEKRIVKEKRKILCGLVSVVLAAVMLFICIFPSTKSVSFDVVLMGDSVIANKVVLQGDSLEIYVATQTGKTVFNGAFGGSSLAVRKAQSESNCSNSWCMVNLARDISLDCWDGAKASMAYADRFKESNRQIFAGYKERLETLSQIDFSKVKVLFIEHGTNDYNSGVALDNETDLFDKKTFGGALRNTICYLQDKFPQLRIVLITPAFCVLGEEGEAPADEKDWGGGLLEEYVEKELEIAAQYGVDVIDFYHNSGIDADNVLEYTVDGLHPNEKGIVLLGDAISNYLKGNEYENNGTRFGVGEIKGTNK